MSLPETFDIHYHYYYNYCYCAYCTSFFADISRFHVIWKKLIKVSQKRGKIIYLYKSVDIYIFFITFKILSKFQDLSRRKVK